MWLILLACTAPDDPAQRPAGEELPTPWVWEDSDPLSSEPDLAALKLAVQAFFDSARQIQAQAVHNNYTAAMALGDDQCPVQATTTSDQGTVRYWDGVCDTRDELVIFKGPMTLWEWEGTALAQAGVPWLEDLLPADGLVYAGRGMMAQTDIFARSGEPDFNCSCFAMYGEGQGAEGQGARGQAGEGGASTGSRSFFNWVDGPTHWTGAETAGTWMEGGGLRAGLWQYYLVDPAAQQVQVKLRGGLTGQSERYDSLWFNVEGTRPLGSAACDADLAVELEARDGITTSRIEATLAYTEGCVACAELEGLGELCADLSPLFDWESSPW